MNTIWKNWLQFICNFADAVCKVTKCALELLDFLCGKSLLTFFGYVTIHFCIKLCNRYAEVFFIQLSPGYVNENVLDFRLHVSDKIFFFHKNIF